MLVPDILADARGFSMGALLIAMGVGLSLWLFGWVAHRFWIVLGVTVGAGLFGLVSGPHYGTQPLIAGLLLAVAAGTLALALVRVVVFAAGGALSWMVLHALAPGWDEPLVCVLVGGLVALLLFRFWTMLLTSALGSVILAYAGLCLADRLGKIDVVGMAERQTTALNFALLGMTLVGWLMQYAADRRRLARLKASAQQDAEEEEEDEDRKKRSKGDKGKVHVDKKPGWRLFGSSSRKAG